MFKAIDLNLNAGAIKNAWLRLMRQIQTTVEHNLVTNATQADMARGEIVYPTAGGNRQMALAVATAAATEVFVGVMAEPTPSGELGVMRANGYAFVLFEANLTPVSGTFAYLSATDDGRATNVAPGGGHDEIVGLIADTTTYATLQGCLVILGHCCAPNDLT